MARKKKSSLGCLFYIALVLLVVVVFLFQWDTVRGVIERTGFLQVLRGRDDPQAPPSVTIEPPERPVAPPAPPAVPAPRRETGERTPPPEPRPAPREVVVQVDRTPPAEKAPSPERSREAEKRVRKSRIFFVSVDADGSVDLKGVLRSVEYVDAPLRATLDALMQGPTPAELNQGLFTTIPPESRLNSITVRNDTAFLDFNEVFRFNSLGTEGLKAQLKQLVYSTTEFSNISRVQFLIEGKKVRFLGPEGTYIGEPLARDSFRE